MVSIYPSVMIATIYLHALEDTGAVVEAARSRIQRQRTEGLDLRCVPTMNGIMVDHQHVVSGRLFA